MTAAGPDALDPPADEARLARRSGHPPGNVSDISLKKFKMRIRQWRRSTAQGNRMARILIADETEQGARGYERFLPGFKKLFKSPREAITTPVDLVPAEMLDTRVIEVWKGMMYC